MYGLADRCKLRGIKVVVILADQAGEHALQVFQEAGQAHRLLATSAKPGAKLLLHLPE